jgi:hypothetical protein
MCTLGTFNDRELEINSLKFICCNIKAASPSSPFLKFKKRNSIPTPTLSLVFKKKSKDSSAMPRLEVYVKRTNKQKVHCWDANSQNDVKKKDHLVAADYRLRDADSFTNSNCQAPFIAWVSHD